MTAPTNKLDGVMMTDEQITRLIATLREWGGKNTIHPHSGTWMLDAADAIELLSASNPAAINKEALADYRRGVKEAFHLANMINANRQGRTAEEICSYLVSSLATLANGGEAPAAINKQEGDKTFALLLMDAAAKSGDPKAIELAMHLAGVPPCATCGFVNYHCRCAAPLDKEASNPAVAQSDRIAGPFDFPVVIDRSHPNQAYVTYGFGDEEACTQFIKATQRGNYPAAPAQSAEPADAYGRGWGDALRYAAALACVAAPQPYRPAKSGAACECIGWVHNGYHAARFEANPSVLVPYGKTAVFAAQQPSQPAQSAMTVSDALKAVAADIQAMPTDELRALHEASRDGDIAVALRELRAASSADAQDEYWHGRIRKWREAFDAMHRRAMRAEARAASPQPAVCATCNGHGMIGGPSYYAPDEGGEPCPDCNVAQPVAQTAKPIGYAKQSQIDSMSERRSALLYSVACPDEDWDVPVYAAPQLAQTAQSGGAVPTLWEAFEMGFSLRGAMLGHVLDGRDVGRLTTCEFWHPSMLGMHEGTDLHVGLSVSEAIVKLKAEVRRRLGAFDMARAAPSAVVLDDGRAAFEAGVLCVSDMNADEACDLERQYSSCVDAARAASPQPVAQTEESEAVTYEFAYGLTEWQPIESAPKDGSLFLGWVDAVKYGESDKGQPIETDVSEVDFCRWQTSECGGYFENLSGPIADAEHITHWMPIPARPVPTTEQPK